ncbi:MAG: PAS domain S-box protein [Chloroflexota bacterium]
MKNLGIAAKLTLIFTLFAMAVLAGLGIPAFYIGSDSLKDAAYSELLSTALEKQSALNSWVADRQHSMADIASQPHLQDNLSSFLLAAEGSAEANLAHATLVKDLANWSGEGHRFLAMELIDATTGRVLISTDASQEGNFRKEQSFFINGLQSAFIQNPEYDLTNQQIRMTAAAPVSSPDGRVLAVLAGPLNLDELNTIILRRSGLHQSDDSFLVNTSNLLVTQPRLINEEAVLLRNLHTEALSACLSHKSGAVAAADYRDIPAFIVYRWLPERQLCLINKIDQVEALAPVRALASTMGLTGALVFLFGTLTALGLSRSIARPVLKLADGAERIRQGDLDTRIEINSQDEIGKLGIAFNDMVAALGEKDTQLLAWSHELEQRVEDRTLELSESEERYRILAETSPDLIFVIDRQDKVQYVNNRAARQFRKSSEQVIGKPRTELFPPALAESQGYALQQVIRSGEVLSSESPVTFPGGQRWLNTQLVPLRDKDGQVNAVMGVSRDVTERKQADLLILEEKTFSDSIINSLPGIFYLFDAQGKFLLWNRNFEKISGYSTDEMLERNPADFFVGDEKVLVQERIQQVFISGQAEVEANFTSRHAVATPYYLTGVRIMIKDQPHLVGVGIDITKRRQAEEKLLKAMADLARSNSELERFAYVASHDLQEPLRMVTSYLQLLERRYKDKLDGDAREFIQFAVDGSNRMKNLIGDLLAYSRVGTRGKEFEMVDCGIVLENVLTNLQISLSESHAKLTHDPLPEVMGDDSQLESLFQNLIGNAIKFHGRKKPKIHVGVKQEARDWVFSVSDNGIGIDPQYFERIFIIFQRLHNLQEYTGTGIGLAISKRIVERHGGRIWIESQPGQGSTFYFTLPMIGGSSNE